jgi:hypothetical protein
MPYILQSFGVNNQNSFANDGVEAFIKGIIEKFKKK